MNSPENTSEIPLEIYLKFSSGISPLVLPAISAGISTECFFENSSQIYLEVSLMYPKECPLEIFSGILIKLLQECILEFLQKYLITFF